MFSLVLVLDTPHADGDGISNTNEFLSGTNPTDSSSGFRIFSVTRQGADISITWRTAGGRTNAVQATGVAGYTTNFSDLSAPITIPGSGDATSNYVDTGRNQYPVPLLPHTLGAVGKVKSLRTEQAPGRLPL